MRSSTCLGGGAPFLFLRFLSPVHAHKHVAGCGTALSAGTQNTKKKETLCTHMHPLMQMVAARKLATCGSAVKARSTVRSNQQQQGHTHCLACSERMMV